MSKWAFEGCMRQGWDRLHDAGGRVSPGKPGPTQHAQIYTHAFSKFPQQKLCPSMPQNYDLRQCQALPPEPRVFSGLCVRTVPF